jgi:hypothetical protein
MLLSHRKRFIYLKTIKTASTSVEIALEHECYPEGEYPGESHERTQHVSAAGIVGVRMPHLDDSLWFNHMPAALVRVQAPKAWAAYTKFCVIRNPFDKVVSCFWVKLDNSTRVDLAQAPFEVVHRAFSHWCARTLEMPMDRDKYVIDGSLCMDRVIRYECLEDDLARVCDDLNLQPRPLGGYKRGLRARPEPFADYYDIPSAAKVAAWFDWELQAFAYRLRD